MQDFFQRHKLPKTSTHPNLVLLSKKGNTKIFADLRPISLSKFSNNVISRVIHDGLKVCYHKLSPVTNLDVVREKLLWKMFY